MGPTALERSLVAHLMPSGIDKLGWGQHTMEGLIGWGGLVARARQQNLPDPRPGTKPWEHLPDLDALSEQLKAALGG